LGIVDVAVLETLERLGAHAGLPYSLHTKCAKAVGELDSEYGLGPDLSYWALCQMARPWVVPLCCVEFHGNVGSPDFPAAGARYTEARLSVIGVLALASERGEIGAIPIGLINGNTHYGGTRPPFEPGAIVNALRRLLEDPAVGDNELADLVGTPVFPTECNVTGDISALISGASVTLRLSARLRPADAPRQGWLVDRLPPGVGALEISERIATVARQSPRSVDLPELEKRTHLPVSKIDDLSTATKTQMLLTAAKGADLEDLRSRLLQIHGISLKLRVEFPAPLPDILRHWVVAHAADDLQASLARLDQLLH
jgi:DNA gyrase/topoisomerase IV subunit A